MNIYSAALSIFLRRAWLPIGLTVFVFIFGFASTSSLAQLPEIPGLEEATAPAPSSSSGEGSISKGKVNLFDMLKAGGIIMIVLGVLSMCVFGLLIFSLIDLRKQNFVPAPLVKNLETHLDQIDLEAAKSQLNPSANCLSAVLLAGFDYLGEKGYGALESDKFEDILEAASKKFNRGRANLIGYFSVIAQASPMLGLLGTVGGMILAFATMSSGGGGDPSAFASDISMALVTTAGGLCVALPAVFCYFFLRNRLKSLVAETDETADELVTRLRRALAAYNAQQGQAS